MSAQVLQADDELESRIDAASDALAEAPTIAERFAAWHELRDLVGQRSPARVAEMEVARGLR